MFNFPGRVRNPHLTPGRFFHLTCLNHSPSFICVKQVSVSGGALHLRTRKRSPPVRGPHGGEWNFTSGWVDTKGKWAQKYGRFEANCSLPGRDATGIWPAFWLMPESDQCWVRGARLRCAALRCVALRLSCQLRRARARSPAAAHDRSVAQPTGGEVDIFEFNGNWLEDEIFGSYHWARAGQCGDDQAPIPGRGVKPTGAGSDWQTGWHVYAVEWFEDRLDFYLDDTLYFSKNSTEVVLPSAPMHVIFDQAVDSWLFPPSWGPGKYGDGVFLSVDYVRVYEATS